ILFNQTVGILGGGQLGKMMGIVIKQMGFKLVVFDESPNSPAGQIADYEIVGSFKNKLLLKEFKKNCSVITFEFENIPVSSIEYLMKIRANIPQGFLPLQIAQNRFNEKSFIRKLGFKTVNFELVKNKKELLKAIEIIQYPAIIKTCTMGYDGKGQIVLNNPTDIDKAVELLKTQTCILEQKISFKKECSIICFRSINGEITTLPVIENIHKNGILFQSIYPANIPESDLKKCKKIGLEFMKKSNCIGTIAIEFFYDNKNQFIFNEIAPRPHNSGHLSIEAFSESQFSLHVKSILGIPFQTFNVFSPAVMTNILGQHFSNVQNNIFSKYKENIYFHLYGKEDPQINRKMGHITILGKNMPLLIKLGQKIIDSNEKK
ncbi:MAG: 5-(carboxyamino)imidazole ribonucleotide synthase, partial [Sediminibacterium sp.]|nr:5-(carboxyamino)imidazole ribonucleotide synthase [Sediminibacterium sp.]